jgi:sulfur carrier protein
VVRIEVNGRARELDGPTTVGVLVDAEVPDRRGVAVAVDGEVLSRAAWDDTPVAEGTRIEIVGAVQGG